MNAKSVLPSRFILRAMGNRTLKVKNMEKQRIRFSLPIDVLVALWNAKEPNEDLDTVIEKYLRIGIKTEAKP
jgi:hypothetical protein